MDPNEVARFLIEQVEQLQTQANAIKAYADQLLGVVGNIDAPPNEIPPNETQPPDPPSSDPPRF